MNLQEIANDVVNTLNHNGFDRVTLDGITDGETAIKSPRCVDCDFTVRVGYWERIDGSLLETMEEYHSVRVNEHIIEDEDCGELYLYEFTIVDKDTGYTLNELNDLDSNYADDGLHYNASQVVEDIEDSYLEEAEFLHKYESGDIWGIA